jgi:hypothetical protein
MATNRCKRSSMIGMGVSIRWIERVRTGVQRFDILIWVTKQMKDPPPTSQ